MRNLAMLCGLALALALAGCADDPQPDVKNRVPTVQGQLDEAQKAAHDAKGYADQVAQQKKDIDAAIDKLNGVGADASGNHKLGAPETSGIGTVTQVGMFYITISNSTTGELWFTFAQRDGFTKKFESVCSDQTIPVNKAVILNFHFAPYQDNSHPGCYVIDSYTVVQ